ncbi:uncharacterized protein A1O9_00576 [Exophiala aquamarina CBS 119918]|uniref:HNH domain-containing protein n=1 Tax=Exophiala aquamarina CBS 119918 TaxID=1182545 RepID=A0A072PTC6_9EURO|nr:uncharacterized protein A1O9_00576 [Exophiala aquamarina CBS 119918]KEF62603.1 hypothetical protein A1O9_00576 [Exophiala aquamarina CBS 119918]
MENDDYGNYDTFRDCIFSAIVEKSLDLSKKACKAAKKGGLAKHGEKGESQPRENLYTEASSKEGDASALAEFSDYLAGEIFTSLPNELKGLSYHATQNDAELSEKWSLPLTLSMIEEASAHISGDVVDSLATYAIIEPPKSDIQSFMGGVLSTFVSIVTIPPPKWIATKTGACEICERDWVPMTYHHLIPRQIHTKVLKRGWHEEHKLNSVAWLCRACHSFVHRMASNEELACDWYTVDRICEREDMQKWAQWVRRVRWKKT